MLNDIQLPNIVAKARCFCWSTRCIANKTIVFLNTLVLTCYHWFLLVAPLGPPVWFMVLQGLQNTSPESTSPVLHAVCSSPHYTLLSPKETWQQLAVSASMR